MDAFGPNGEALLEYSIYDAIRAGFSKVIFVIRRDFETEFKNLIGDKFKGKIEVEYAFQELTDLPHGFSLPTERQKPRGTAHAVLCATEFVQEPFAVINADDFYGKESYQVLADFLFDTSNDDKCCIVGYTLSKVMSEYGSVSRGICEVDTSRHLLQVVENKKIYQKD
jgi:dTDP-glucose pyrophosphorylase